MGRSQMTFTVIDNKTGKEVNIDKIVKEKWAKGLMECDIDCFALTEDGKLVLLDDCGTNAYCPDGRFTVIETPGEDKCVWIKYDYRTICPKNHDIDNPYWRIPEKMDKLNKKTGVQSPSSTK